MINPTPVNSKGSPYGSQYGQSTVLPRTLATTPVRKNRPWRKAFFLGLLTCVVAGGTYAFAQYASLKSNVIVEHQGESSNILNYKADDSAGKLDPSLFKQAGDGRFNIVLVGIGGDGHPGANLTDSIQVISLDTINKKVGVTSLPRDFYYKGSKINSVYQFAEDKQKGSGPLALREAVGTVLGIKISNFVMVDFAGFKDAVDSLGGIDVDVPKTINDPYFPDDATVGYAPFSITQGPHHLDGKTALRYARSRETTSDFDRSARQQLIMQALRTKALSAGVLANPVKISNLLTALGKHVKTDLQTDDIKALALMYKDMPSGSISTNVLDTSDKLGLLTATNDPTAGYISYPILGYTNYTAVHGWFQKNNPDPLLVREAPTVTVVNGAYATPKQLQAVVDTLKDYGYNAVLGTATVKKGQYAKTQLFETGKDKKPFSRNYLASLYSTTSQVGSPLSSGSDFELVYIPTTTTSTK